MEIVILSFKSCAIGSFAVVHAGSDVTRCDLDTACDLDTITGQDLSTWALLPRKFLKLVQVQAYFVELEFFDHNPLGYERFKSPFGDWLLIIDLCTDQYMSI